MTKNMTDTTVTLSTDDETAFALIAHVQSAATSGEAYLAYVAAHNVTRENLADHARALAVLAYPNEKPVQIVDGKRTPLFGNAVQAAGKGLRTALGKGDPKATDWLRLVAQAASNAQIKGEFSADKIMAAVTKALMADDAEADDTEADAA